MQRATLAVELLDGTRYDANHLAVTHTNVEGASVSALSFISSGVQKIVPADQVKSVSWTPCGAFHCSECDQSLWHVHGGGVSANPPPERER